MINISIKKGHKREITVPYGIGTTFNGKVYPLVEGALPPNIQIMINQPYLDGTLPFKFTIFVGGLVDAGVYTFIISGTPKPDSDMVCVLNVVDS